MDWIRNYIKPDDIVVVAPLAHVLVARRHLHSGRVQIHEETGNALARALGRNVFTGGRKQNHKGRNL